MAISRSQIPSQIDPFENGGAASGVTQDQIEEIKKLMAIQSDIEKSQREAKINTLGGDFDTNFKKYEERLGQFAYQAPRMDIFDLASELGAGLLSTPNIGGASAFTGLGVGFNRISERLKKEEADNAKANQQIGMQAAQLALRDEQRAEDFLNQYALKKIDAANKQQSYVTFEYDEDDGSGNIVRRTKTLPNTLANREEINTILRDQNGVKISDSQTNINMPQPVSHAEKTAIDSITSMSADYKAKHEAAIPIIDQVNAAYILALRVKDQDGDFGPFTSATLRARELISELGFGDLLEAEGAIAPQKALNQLSMGFTMAIVSQTKGAISDREMKLFIAASPTLGSTFEGYMNQLQMLEKLASRDTEFYKDYLDEMTRLENEGIFGKKQEIALNKFRVEWSDKNPLLTLEEEAILQEAIDNPNIAEGFIPKAYEKLFNNRKAEMAREKASLPVVTSQQEYDALESGERYIENGMPFKKP
tara:strand:- start:3189 stop:4622 length:1434 start_codon:yes stop_codon:yes gene_type:complete